MNAFPELKFGNLCSKAAIIQGGMGIGVSLSGLAAAVANEGGIGVIAAAMTGIGKPDSGSNIDQSNIISLKQEIRLARAKTSGIIGINIMVALTSFGDQVKAALEEKIDIIFAGAGLPLNLPGYLQKGDLTKLVPIISSARAAKIIIQKWLKRYSYLPDGFVVEGPMAGGHLGFKPEQLDNPDFCLEKLVSEVLVEVKKYENKYQKRIPVIAAGGVYNGNDIRKYLKLGASGVQLGTRFAVTHECDADLKFKQALINAKKEDLVIIKSPVGLPGRAVSNQFLQDVKKGNKKPFKCPFHCIKTCDPENTPYCISLALVNAKKGRLKHGFAFAGQNAYRVNKIMSVKELMDDLKHEYISACNTHINNAILSSAIISSIQMQGQTHGNTCDSHAKA